MRSRTSTTLLVSVLAMGLLSGCTPQDGRTYPNAVDLTRAQRAWSDPWLAPETATTVEPQGAAPQVRRDVAGRSYLTTSTPRTVVATEVRAAIATGWRLVGLQCEADEQGFAGAATAELTRGSTVEDGIVTSVRATLGSVDATQPQKTSVGVGAYVSHHLDTSWPARDAIELEGSCLLDTSSPPSSPPSPSPTQPLASPSATASWAELSLTGEGVEPPEWADDPVPDDLRDALAGLGADKALSALGVSLTTPGKTEGAGPRNPAQSKEKQVKTPGDLTATVTSLTSQGWTLTYAGCLGTGAPNVAELSRPAAKRTAVLRLSQVPTTDGAPQVEATAVVSTPGYSPEPATGINDPCFADSETPKTFSHKGVPSLGPTRMFPLQR